MSPHLSNTPAVGFSKPLFCGQMCPRCGEQGKTPSARLVSLYGPPMVTAMKHGLETVGSL